MQSPGGSGRTLRTVFLLLNREILTTQCRNRKEKKKKRKKSKAKAAACSFLLAIIICDKALGPFFFIICRTPNGNSTSQLPWLPKANLVTLRIHNRETVSALCRYLHTIHTGNVKQLPGPYSTIMAIMGH